MTEVIPLYFRGITGNCFLLKEGSSGILVDTARKTKRKKLEAFLAENLPEQSSLKLVILSHGDFDHSGNAAFLQRHYKVPAAMHPADSGMVTTNNMFYGRTSGNRFLKWLLKTILGIETFTPDVLLEDGMSLKEYGFDASILHTPGHSSGSICVLCGNGKLICGDMFENRKKPSINSTIDNKEQASTSIAKLKKHKINEVFPGHGRMFHMDELSV